ncbi:glycosyl transferase group 1 [Methanohalobium evestigatum Z-7303]|uniref:Glycosyl transferase group 1 n=1 Tax=Methanohalobium evestigatum (strain ATCC BAA-1072 / DSM 3721 / NBRC 107634 / OCM 161 / Z-7303) TaxID=644295 RepID=D7E7P9_METEZ|nr:glycosyltransferase [Methanohalobium evestigatum]ADI74122.1 glycosyl transferase group 1 [Methanohalobium evestigatum Z-7303]
MVKIVYLLSKFPKLSESFILNEIFNLKRKGFDIYIFSIYKPSESIVHDELDNELLNKTYYFDITYVLKNLPKFIKYYLKYIIKELLDKRLPLHATKMAYFSIIIEKIDINHIHAHFATKAAHARVLSNIFGLSYTLTAHAYDLYRNPNISHLKRTLDDAEYNITISEYNKNYMKNVIGSNNNINVIRCGIDYEKFKPTNKQNNSSRVKILSVSRLIEKKGHIYLIRSIPEVIKHCTNCEFIIVGSGELENELKKLVEELNIKEYVNFVGDVTDYELIEYYNTADIFVLPCVIDKNGDRDGIPVAMMEAMSMELPVISTNVSGIPELVENENTGLIIPEKNVKQLTNAIIRLCKNPDERKKMGIKGRQIIVNKFNIDKETDKLGNLFKKVDKYYK